MNSIQILHKIKNNLNEISNLNNHLLSENKLPNKIEIELLKKHCVNLYDTILNLETAAESGILKTSETINDTIVEQKKEDESLKEKVEKPIISSVETEIKNEEDFTSAEEEILIQPANEIIKEILNEIKITDDEKITETPFQETLTEKKSNLINLPQSELSLHQKISGNKQTDLNERINESKVESLKSAIGLNKKIAFVNDLFKENTVEYAKAIDKLNTLPDLIEAMNFFNELKQQYSWHNDNENVIELEQLIQKRFR